MTSSHEQRTPFVLGKPIKNPADFYGRGAVLGRVFDAILEGQLVSVVGEHRCGNTSVIYQAIHPDVRARYLTPQQDAQRVYAFISAALASDSTEAFFRRLARALRRADEDAQVDFDGAIDRVWLENYLEDLTDRDQRLVLLMDEFEILADFDPAFWDWFEKLVTEYDVAMVVTSRMDLGTFRSESGSGPPFFNMFRTIPVGSFRKETFDEFLRDKSEITDFDFQAQRDAILDLAGRFPYYVQVAAALMYLHAGGESKLTDAQVEIVRHEFRARTAALFEDAWAKLPATERDALMWLVLDAEPTGDDAASYREALRSLEQRGYILDGRLFSSAFAVCIRSHTHLISLDASTGRVRVGTAVVHPPAEAFAMLTALADAEGRVVTTGDLGEALWPDLARNAPEAAENKVRATAEALRAAIDGESAGEPHIEELSGLGIHGYRFVNELVEF